MAKLFFCLGLCLLVLMVDLLPLGRGEIERVSDTVRLCDNAKDNITMDLGPESNWLCPANSTIIKHSYMYSPAPSCNATQSNYQPQFVCMDTELTYTDHPPSVGDYRPLPPQYGEYSYLPPQRWLHALRLGAVAFLYHPCAPQDQVDLLKSIARECLWKHVITPYPSLSHDKPLAVVSWGCVYRMGWVNPPLLREWLTQHALMTDQSSDLTDEGYNEGLISEPDHELPPNEVCPHQTTPQTTPTPCTNCTCPDCPTIHTIFTAHSNRLTVLLALVIIILILAILLVLWRFYLSCSVKVKTKGRYKSVSKYFPVGGVSREGMAIPEMGLPKHGLAEQEKLLDTSDEDEL